MVPQHTRPVEDENQIMDILTSYRDAIQIVHDQTVRYMNKGLYPDEITQKVVLPPHLANHPYLIEFYGTVEWSVKAVFCNYMGWFSGEYRYFFLKKSSNFWSYYESDTIPNPKIITNFFNTI